MANLIPENIPSRNDIPERLRTAARLLREALPGDVVVSLERTGDDPAAAQRKDLGYEVSGSNSESVPYLVVFDPAAGILVLESPTLRPLGANKRRRFRRRPRVGLDQARRAIVARVDGLQHKIGSLPVARALALPDVRRDEPQSLADDEAPPRLHSEDFHEDTLLAAIRQILGGGNPPLDNQGRAQVRAAINPNIAIGRQGQMFDTAPQTSKEMIRVLDLAQERLAEHLGPGYRLIRGVAGSGKTLVLTHRARYIGENMRRWRILLVCFNVALAQALKLELKDVENVTVLTVDSLANRVIRDAGHTATEGGGEAFETRRKEALAAAATLSPSKRYDMVLVDEAQDLGNSGLDLAWAVGKQELSTDRRHFVIALDSAQNVYRRRMNWNPPGVTARGRSTALRENYRNTKQTLDFALGTIAGIGQHSAGQASPDDLDAFVIPQAALRHGRDPDLLECGDLRTEAETLTKKTAELLRNGAAHDDIVIMSGSKELRLILLQTLSARRIPALDAQQERDRVVLMRGEVRVATLQLLKGLEYRHVLIGGVSDIWVNDDEDETRQRLLYVAITRATETLTVTYSGDGSMSRLLRAARP